MSKTNDKKTGAPRSLDGLVGLLEAQKKAEEDLAKWFDLNFADRLRDAKSEGEVTEIRRDLRDLGCNELPAIWGVKFALAFSRFHKPNV